MTPGTTLFNLLPALYRLKDAQLAAAQQLALGPLQSLLAVIEEQLAVIANDLDQLYDDQFIETCAPWVIPYIGALIGYQSVHGKAPALASPRAEVAHTISFRQRKGTILALEQLARDATGWGAHAREFFKVLATSQYMNHIRPGNHYAPDLRCWQVAAYLDTAFDATAHNADVRRIAEERGRHNIPNIGIFLWSLGAYSLTLSPATASASNSAGHPACFRFSPLGRDIPLFTSPVSQGSEITAAATPRNVPDRLLRRVLCQDLASGAGSAYYGLGNSLVLYSNGLLLNPYQIQVCDLSGADGFWANLPPPLSPAGSAYSYPYAAAVDSELGRIAVPPVAAGSPTPQIQATFYQGFNAQMGGGEYPREEGFVVQEGNNILPFPDTASPARYSTLQQAVTYAASQLSANGQIALEIAGSGVQPSYVLTAPLSVSVPASATLEIRGADGSWPMLVLNGAVSVTGGASSSLVLNGLLLSSSVAPGSPPGTPPVALIDVPANPPSGGPNQLGSLVINHCTLVPGWALATNGNPQHGAAPAVVAQLANLQIVIQSSILGPLETAELVTVNLTNSIVDATSLPAATPPTAMPSNVAYSALDGTSGGGALTLQGCTVIGKIHASLCTLISDSIVWAGLASGDTWAAPLIADRRQSGCVRFSYLPAGSITPRRFECIEQGEGLPQPLFYSLTYGDPGYAKLLPSTGDPIRRGADDGGEMGAFHFVWAPFRETDLLVRITEYLPAGLEFGVFYEN
jgi:hypothetical protein